MNERPPAVTTWATPGENSSAAVPATEERVAIEAGSEELVPTRGRHSCQESSIVDLLQKNQVRAVEFEKGWQASQVPPLLGVVGEEGEEGSKLPPT